MIVAETSSEALLMEILSREVRRTGSLPVLPAPAGDGLQYRLVVNVGSLSQAKVTLTHAAWEELKRRHPEPVPEPVPEPLDEEDDALAPAPVIDAGEGKIWADLKLRDASPSSFPVDEEDKAPPIGIEPEYIWMERRVRDLDAAVQRYEAFNKRPTQVTAKWRQEVYRLVTTLLDKQPRKKLRPIHNAHGERVN